MIKFGIINKMHTQQDIHDSPTNTTEPPSPRSFSSTNKSPKNKSTIQNILSSTEEIINEQAKQIFHLNKELNQQRKQNRLLLQKYDELTSFDQQKKGIEIHDLLDKITFLETQLASTKMELAQCKGQLLETKHKSNIRPQPTKQKKNIPTEGKSLSEFFKVQMLRDSLNFLKKKLTEPTESQNAIEEWKKNIDIYSNSQSIKAEKFKQKTTDLAKKFIPHSLRENVWPLLFENVLGITNSLYIELFRRREKGMVPEKVTSQIEKDINRSFYGKTEFESKTGLSEEVQQMLEVFHLYRPDVSYVQGMTYPVIVLDLITGKIKGFIVFCNIILANPFFRRLFTFEGNYVNIYCRAFDYMLEDYQPLVYQFLVKKNLHSQIYLIQWFFTFFSRGLSYQSTLKIWDLLAYFSELLFFRASLCILELLSKRIVLESYDTGITLIRQFSEHINQNQLFSLIWNHRLSHQKMEKYIQKSFKNSK